METFTLNAGTWIRRLATNGPLVRTSDRIEAAVGFLVLVLILLALPVAGALGTTAYDTRMHEYAAQRLTTHRVDAVAMDAGSPPSRMRYQDAFATPVQWQFAGKQHIDTVRTPVRLKPGDHKSVWVDGAGNRTVAPPTDRDAAIDAASIAVVSWLAVAGAGAAVLVVVHSRVNRRRYAGWDRELEDLADNGRTNRS
ncbi:MULTISPECIES: Rv1733c family protein [unclassified Mycolicibacterium]|uniref:Rv1733c family protein n=1 Tax=unclassified Mycolicibacterium TaxID=2636767 RepID=UPI002EDA84F4